LLPQPALAAETTTIEIIKNQDGAFVFDKPAVTINSGDAVQWKPKDAGVPHRLLPDSDQDAFKETTRFTSATNPPVSQTFESPGIRHYHCFFHPDTMKGTITVAAPAKDK
jgi:plastocyanin